MTDRVAEWNRTEAEFDTTRCVHQEIEQSARRRPRQAAIIFRDRVLTYQQLNERADRLARHLCANGIGPDRPVAIGVERSPEMVVAILGVLKAGGAYLPLDPAFPKDRTDFMLADSEARAIVTSGDLRERFADAAVPVLCVHTDAETLNPTAAPPVPNSAGAHHHA